MIRLLKAPAVGHQLLYHLPVHKGLPAEKIHLQIHSVPGILYQKVQSLFPHLKTHKGTSSVIFPFLCKTVFTGQVAVMGNVETQGLHHRLPLFKVYDIIFVDIRRIEHSFFLKL